ncbi:hypothetical protein AB7M63_006277 [Bradyrhizobium japonicum]
MEPESNQTSQISSTFLQSSLARDPRKAFAGAVHVPGVGAFFHEGFGDALVDDLVLQDLGRAVALLAHEHGDRHAPGALARDHPVRTIGDHAVDAVLARRRHPLRDRDRVQRAGAQRVALLRMAVIADVLVHRDEPLRRVAEDHRLLRAPRMRILVLEAAAREQLAAFDQRLDHGLVGIALLALVVEHALAGEAGGLCGVGAVLVDGVGDRGRDAARIELAGVGRPDVEVLAAVARRGVHEAGAGVVGDMLAGEQRHDELVTAAEPAQGMGAFHGIQRVAGNVAHLFVRRYARLLEHLCGERIGQDQEIAGLGPVVGGRIRHLIKAVGDLRRERDRAVAGQRPGRGGPDHDRGTGECAMRR